VPRAALLRHRPKRLTSAHLRRPDTLARQMPAAGLLPGWEAGS